MSVYEMTNKCNMCGQHQLIEAGSIGDEPWFITVEEFAKNNIEAYPKMKARAELINELHDKVKTCCQVYSDAPLKFALEVTNITKDILSKAKEL